MNNPQPSWDFFLAHAGPDALLADELYELLYPVARTFLDSRSLLLGDDWDRKLLNAQRNSRITVVLISNNTDRAYYQREEIANAIEMARKQETEHRVVPVYVDTSAEEIDTPYGLKLKHGVKLSEVGGIDGVAGKLLQLLAKVKSQESCNSDLGPLTEKELRALFILQQTSHAIPARVLHEAAGIDANPVAGKLSSFIAVQEIEGESSYILSDISNAVLRPRDSDDLLARPLEDLIGFIGQHKNDGIGAFYVGTALSLARVCKDIRPRAPRKFFDAVDGILKLRGDKNMVYEVANLSIEAAKHSLRDEEDVRIEARALICGKSWVLQRVGHLDEALAEALKSLALGEKIRWERNTAFCKKCLGRLYRLLAMREVDPAKKSAFFRKSIESLREAVGIFRDMDRFGPDCCEVGDCYSLAARTYLVAGQMKEARTYLNKASERLSDQTDKDYLDYRILEGDYAEAVNAADSAEENYQFVIGTTSKGDSDKSEIRARALFQRGLSRARRKMKEAASSDFKQAAQIWDDLKEPKRAAEARWEMILLSGMLAPMTIVQLNRACATERVIAVRLHEKKMAKLSSGNARRSGAERKYWDQLINDAAEQDAKQDIFW